DYGTFGPGTFQSGSNYVLCPSFVPNANAVGPWTMSVYLNGSPTPFMTVGFSFTSAADGGTAGGGPEAYWKFDEGSGAQALDSTGNGNTGRLLNGAGWAAGIKGTALNLDGVDDYVDVGTTLKVTSANFTIEAWVKGDPTMQTYGRIVDADYASSYSLSAYNPSAGSPTRVALFEFQGSARLYSTAVIIDNTWHHVAVVKAGSTAT